MNMNFSIEEVHDLTKKAHNAAIEVAAKILDVMHANWIASAKSAESESDSSLSFEIADMLRLIAKEIRSLKLE